MCERCEFIQGPRRTATECHSCLHEHNVLCLSGTYTYIHIFLHGGKSLYKHYIPCVCSYLFTYILMHAQQCVHMYIYYRAAHTCIHSYRPIYLYIVPVRSSGLRRYIHICAFGRKVDYQETREELTSAFSAPVALSLPRERRGGAGDR